MQVEKQVVQQPRTASQPVVVKGNGSGGAGLSLVAYGDSDSDDE